MELSSFYGPTHLINMNGWAMTPWNTFPNVKCLVYAATQGTMPEDVAARAKDNADYDSQYFVLNDDGDAVVTPLALFPDTNIFFVEYDRQAYLPAIVGKTNSGGKKVNYLNELNGFANYYVLSDAKPGYPSWYKINYEIDKDLSSRESPGSSSGQRFYDFSGNGTPPKTRVYLSAPFNRKISDFYKYEINGTSYDTNNSTTDSNGYDGVAF